MKIKYIKKILYVLIVFLLFISCKSPKLKKTPVENFVGAWELLGREMYNGIVIRIEKDINGDLKGSVIQKNDEKYVKMFVEVGDTWVSNIERLSNYEFKLTERKIAGGLFALYGQSTSQKYNVQFIDENTIGLGTGNTDPIESSVIYKRIE